MAITKTDWHESNNYRMIISDKLRCYVKAKSFFGSRFQGTSDDSIIRECVVPEKTEGGLIDFQLISRSTDGRQEPVWGDATIEAKPTLYNVRVGKFQQTHCIYHSTFMDMTPRQFRKCVLVALCDKFAKSIDAMIFRHLTGEHGNRISEILHPNLIKNQVLNTLHSPDAARQIFSGSATCEDSLTADHKMNRQLIVRAKIFAQNTINGPNAEEMRPIQICGRPYYVLVMHPRQKHDLRQNLGEIFWGEIRKRLNDDEIQKSKITRGAFGIIDDIILYSNLNILTYKGGADRDVDCATALLLGREAGAIAYGSVKDGRQTRVFGELRDYENQWSFVLEQMMGFNKFQTGPKNLDCGAMRLDTVAQKQTK